METEPMFTIHPEPLEVYVRVTDTVLLFNDNDLTIYEVRGRDRAVAKALLRDAIRKLESSEP